MKVLLLIAAIIGMAYCDGFNILYRQCSSTATPTATPAKISFINVDPCPEAAGGSEKPCILHKGGASTISVNFNSTQGADKVWMVLKGKIGVVWIPYKSVGMCDTGAIQCPIKAGQQYTTKLTVPISSGYPTLKLVVSVQIQDENFTDLSCAEFNVQIE